MDRVKVKHLTCSFVFARSPREFSPAFPVLYEPTSELSLTLSLDVTGNIIAATRLGYSKRMLVSVNAAFPLSTAEK